jgi:hypothetical protein
MFETQYPIGPIGQILRNAEDALYEAKKLIDSYSSALLELHSAWALILIGGWIAIPFFDIFKETPTFQALQVALNNEPFWGGLIFVVGFIQLVVTKRNILVRRRQAAFIAGCLWSALCSLFIAYSPKMIGTVITVTFIVSNGISYIRLTDRTK